MPYETVVINVVTGVVIDSITTNGGSVTTEELCSFFIVDARAASFNY
ncbi:hypothetical protein [Neptunomonas antarctica]|nr:hypothetical protein [Neptunomonas antarctica]